MESNEWVHNFHICAGTPPSRRRQLLVALARNRPTQREENRDSVRINTNIRITPIRVVSEDGEQLGIIPTEQALERARDSGLDLVEVAPNERPPVCRIMDYGKYKYDKNKKRNTGQAHRRQKRFDFVPKPVTKTFGKLRQAEVSQAQGSCAGQRPFPRP